jgi:flagellar hook-associated protein 3 FlgL
MKIGHVSTLVLNNTLRASTMAKQVALGEAQLELSTGRHADIGRELGAFTSSYISLEKQVEYIDQTMVTNSFTSNRFSMMQAGMKSMVETANDFVSQMSAEMSENLGGDFVTAISSRALETLGSSINSTFRGEFIFSGLNTGSEALVDYNGTSGAAAKTAVQNAFTTAFGFPPNDPLASSLNQSDIENFVNNEFADLFNDANWESLWSGATQEGTTSKISERGFVENKTTAHDKAFRTIVSASVLTSELGNIGLNGDALDQLAKSSLSLMAQGIAEIGDQQGQVGILEGRVSQANEQMEIRNGILQSQIADLTQVDPYDAAIRLNELQTGLQASYAVTARIQSLSLLNYI